LFSQFSRSRENGEEDFSIYHTTLAFRDSTLESKFRASYFKSNLQMGRACHLIAVLFFGIVGMWNALVVDPSNLGTWIGAISCVTLMFLLGLASSYFALDYYTRYWQPLFAFYVLLTGTAFTLVSIASAPHLSVFNSEGIVISLFFCYAFIRLTVIWATAAGNAIVLIYIIGTGLYVEQSLSPFLTASFYLFGINLLGMMVCYSIELMSRRDFMLNELLKGAEKKTKHMNIQLEEMVAERTKALQQTNAELRVSIKREQELVATLEKEEKKLQKSLKSIEQAETISKLGYFEINWQTGGGYTSKGFRKLLKQDNATEDFTYDDFLQRIHAADIDRISSHIQEALKKHSPMDDEFRFIQNSGHEIQIHGIADSFYDDKGEPLLTRGVLQDITDRKQAEAALKKLESQLIQAQKMESVGRLAGGVAHDYNNISGIIIGYTELVMDKLKPDDALYGYLEEILAAAQRAADITRQLLAFARQQTIAPKVIDVNQTVEGMLKILRRLIGENIDLAWLPGEAVWPVKIDPTQLDQVLANLCVNAKDAISDVGKVIIKTRNITLDETYGTNHLGFVPGEYTMLAVSDDGEGMTPETLEKVFEPFFTTKDVGQGTGLGLATVYGVVRQNSGYIDVYSEPQEGTIIKIYLPRYSGQPVEVDIKKPDEVPIARGEVILLVEDDASILKLGRQMLGSLGYTVLAVNKPGDALAVAKERGGEINLLISDVVMPEMNGRELANTLQAICPDLKTLFMSGYTANVIAHHGVLEEGINFISKPFSKLDLAVNVKKILSEPVD
jgi:signal transduction histidine kinase/CheY-like chemotaxis protein